jgi:hypothetical protein
MCLCISSEFKSIHRELDKDEYRLLESQIVSEGGCRDPLVVWDHSPKALHAVGLGVCKETGCKYEYKQVPASRWEQGDGRYKCPECGYGIAPWEDDVLLDGHNRHEICQKHELKFKIVKKHFLSHDDALLWIIDNQLGRRNLTPIDKVPLAERKREMLEKRARERQGTRTDIKENLPESDRGQVRDQLAEQVGVSGKTYDAMVKVTRNGAPELIQSVRDKRIGAATAADVAELGEEDQREVVARGEKGILQAAKEIRERRKLQGLAVLHSSESNEWYTPAKFVNAARKLMGDIDLDPASSEAANKAVKAGKIFTIDDDGLSKKWKGRVWLNPPYGRGENNESNQGVWSRRLIGQHNSSSVEVSNMFCIWPYLVRVTEWS